LAIWVGRILGGPLSQRNAKKGRRKIGQLERRVVRQERSKMLNLGGGEKNACQKLASPNKRMGKKGAGNSATILIFGHRTTNSKILFFSEGKKKEGGEINQVSRQTAEEKNADTSSGSSGRWIWKIRTGPGLKTERGKVNRDGGGNRPSGKQPKRKKKLKKKKKKTKTRRSTRIKYHLCEGRERPCILKTVQKKKNNKDIPKESRR